MKNYCRFFETEEDAYRHMVCLNRKAERDGRKNETFALVDGPDNDFAVVDIATAIYLNVHYEWAY